MIALLILAAMYGGPFLGLLMVWMRIGWHYSLTAAPHRYELVAAGNEAVIGKETVDRMVAEKDKELENKRLELWRMHTKQPCHRNTVSSCTCAIAEEWLDLVLKGGKEVVTYRNSLTRTYENPEEAARKMGKKCILYGPFAYFQTPQFDNKIKVNWTPTSVVANNLVIETGKTLREAQTLGDNVKSALDLEFFGTGHMNRKELLKKQEVPAIESKINEPNNFAAVRELESKIKSMAHSYGSGSYFCGWCGVPHNYRPNGNCYYRYQSINNLNKQSGREYS